MKRYTAAALVLGLFALAVWANPPAAVAPVQVVPAYGTAYQPPGQHDDVLAELKLLVAELRGLRADVAELKQLAGGPQAPAAQKKADPLAVVRAGCAGCHSPAAAEARGGGFALFADDGATLAPLSAREKARASARVKSGSMPPPPAKLSAPDRAAVAEFLQKGK